MLRQKLNIEESYRHSSTTTVLTTSTLKNIQDWFVSGLATCGLLIGLLLVLAMLFPSLGSDYLDPWVYWASRLVW